MKTKYIVIGLLAILVLAGGAFMAGRLLQRPAQAEGGMTSITGPNGEILSQGSGMVIAGGNVAEGQDFSVTIEHAPELPDRAPDAAGQVLRVEDNSVFVMSGAGLQVMVTMDEGGEAEVDMGSPEEGGTEVEVVITKDTKIYRDAMQPLAFNPGEEDLPDVIQQEVEPITLADINGDRGALSAWGQQRGDRLVADVVLYIGF